MHLPFSSKIFVLKYSKLSFPSSSLDEKIFSDDTLNRKEQMNKMLFKTIV